MKTTWCFAAPLTTLTLAALLLTTSPASAQTIEDWSEENRAIESPEHFTLELRGGAYLPQIGGAFSDTFGNGLTPLLSVELDAYPVRIPYIGLIGGGGGFGWAQWVAASQTVGGQQATGQDTSLTIFPMYAVVVWRFDTLARYLDIPLVLVGKFGLDFIFWDTGKGDTNQATGWSIGLRFAAQAALELDFIDRRAARQLDEAWGINHTALFFEIWGSTAGEFSSSMLNLSGWGWQIGLGFQF